MMQFPGDFQWSYNFRGFGFPTTVHNFLMVRFLDYCSNFAAKRAATTQNTPVFTEIFYILPNLKDKNAQQVYSRMIFDIIHVKIRFFV